MIIPFHSPHCRENWGCPYACPVRMLVEEHKELQDELARALHAYETYKQAYKDK